MKKCYVLSEVGYDYNDEINFVPESEGSTPHKTFSSKEKAEKELERLNITRFKQLVESDELHSYYYNIEDIFDSEIDEIINVNKLQDDFVQEILKLNEEKLKEIYKHCNLVFFVMHEVELE